MPKKYLVFNINENVEVKLTPHGEEVWKKHYQSLWRSICPTHMMPDFFDQLPDMLPSGRRRFPLWQLMAVFGPVFYCGDSCRFQDNEIWIPEEESPNDDKA